MARSTSNDYLKRGIGFLNSSFLLPYYADQLQLEGKQQQTVVYRVPLQLNWFHPDHEPDDLPDVLHKIHDVLENALVWTTLGDTHFEMETGTFFKEKHPAHRANLRLSARATLDRGSMDTFKASMVLVLTVQIGLAASLLGRYTRYGNIPLPLTALTGEAIASIMQTAADPALTDLPQIAEHYVNSWCAECVHFRSSRSLMDSGYCEWARESVPDMLRVVKHPSGNPIWRLFVTHPKLQTGFYNAAEREETANQYRDRVAQWFDEDDQVTLDPTTLHLIEDVLNAARNEDELLDTDVVLPRALRLMDFWHSGYLPSSGESQHENPTLLVALEEIPDALLPLVLSSLTVSPPQYICIGFLPSDEVESDIGSLQLRIKPLRDVLLQALPRRVLELLALSYLEESNDTMSYTFLRYLHEQASISFERIMLDYDDVPTSWLFEPIDFHLTDIMYIYAHLSAFIHDVTLETIQRITQQDQQNRKGKK